MAALVHIIDDDRSFRVTLGRLLRECRIEVALYECGEHFISQAVDETRPSCIILDSRLPGMNGLELQRRLIEGGSILPVIFLTANGDIPTSVLAIKRGAEDFLTKPVSKQRLLSAIESALAKWRSNSLRASFNTLTPRERVVLEQLVSGKLNKQIAFELGITERTVKAHRRSIRDKLRVRGIAEMVSVAERLNVRPAGLSA